MARYYEHDITQTTWPHESHQLAFWNEHIRGTAAERHFETYRLLYEYWDLYGDDETIYDELRNLDLISRNYLQLNFMFEEKAVTHLDETPSVSIENMLANIGGLMNLWAGITFYTLFELFELAYYLLRNRIANRSGKMTRVAAM